MKKQRFYEKDLKNIFSDWKILSMDELLQLLWVQYNNLKEKEEIVNEIHKNLEKYNFKKNIKEVPNYRNYWQFKEIIKKLVLEWKNSVEILEDLWYDTWFFDQRSLQQYVRKYLWLNIKKRIPNVIHKENLNKEKLSLNSNRFDHVSIEHFLENISQSKNLEDLIKKFWLTTRNSNARKELFEKIQELWLDISHLKNVLTKETMYNFRDHIQTIMKCLQEWKDLSEILYEIWIKETQHSRKMLRKFIKNKDRLMNIKLETTWNTYFQDMRNEQQEISIHKEELKKQDFNEYQKENWDEEKIRIFKRLDNIWKENLQKIITESWTFEEFRNRLKISKIIRFSTLWPYFISKWINADKFDNSGISFFEFHDKIIELSNEWKNIIEILSELKIKKSRRIQNRLKFYIDSNNINVQRTFFDYSHVFKENEAQIKDMIEKWIERKEIISFLIWKLKEKKYIQTDRQKIKTFNRCKKLLREYIKLYDHKNQYLKYWEVYIYDDEKKLREVCKISKSFSEAIETYWYDYNMYSKSHFRKAIIRYWINISHFKSLVSYWNEDYIKLKQTAKLKRKENKENRKILSLIRTFCVWSNTQHSKVRKSIFKYNLFEYKCLHCWLSNDYNWKDLSIQLDHIDWDDHNNSLTNLRFLCPNCHSQTDTYWSKNVWRVHKKNTWKVDDALKKVLDKFFPWWSDKEQFKKYL